MIHQYIKTSFNFRINLNEVKTSHLNAFVMLSEKYTKVLESIENVSVFSEMYEEKYSILGILEIQMRLLVSGSNRPLEDILTPELYENL